MKRILSTRHLCKDHRGSHQLVSSETRKDVENSHLSCSFLCHPFTLSLHPLPLIYFHSQPLQLSAVNFPVYPAFPLRGIMVYAPLPPLLLYDLLLFLSDVRLMANAG